MKFTDKEKIILLKSLKNQISSSSNVEELKLLINIYDKFWEDMLDKCYYKHKKDGRCLYSSLNKKCSKYCSNYEFREE